MLSLSYCYKILINPACPSIAWHAGHSVLQPIRMAILSITILTNLVGLLTRFISAISPALMESKALTAAWMIGSHWSNSFYASPAIISHSLVYAATMVASYNAFLRISSTETFSLSTCYISSFVLNVDFSSSGLSSSYCFCNIITDSLASSNFITPVSNY